MLKITVPFKEKDEVIPLIKAGADELYCGYLSPEWIKQYTALEFERKGGGSNFKDIALLRQAVDLAHQNNVPVYLALNGLYVNQQYPLLLKVIRDLSQIDFDAFIVADIGLLLTLLKQGWKGQIHVSTGGTAFNSEAAKFYKDLGAARIVLDRQMSLEAIRELSLNNPDVDFEVFILNTLCVYIDGFCTFLHTYGREGVEEISQGQWQKDEKIRIATSYDPDALSDACFLKYAVEVYDSNIKKKIQGSKVIPTFYKQLIDGIECGACALYDLAKTSVTSVKIVGRQYSSQKRLQDLCFIRRVLDILRDEKDISRRGFVLKVQELYRKAYNYKKLCRGNNCYHPEVLSGSRSG